MAGEMAKQDSPWIVGDFWLDKRAGSPKWQIFWYDAGRRTTRSISTGELDLGRAKEKIAAHALEKSKPTSADPKEIKVAAVMATYWTEHGQHAASWAQIRASLRHWSMFLFDDEKEQGRGATTVAQIDKRLINRFIAWRSKPHQYTYLRRGKEVSFSSQGVGMDSIDRNLDDLKAALGHAKSHGDLILIPDIPSIPQDRKSGPRELVLSLDQMREIVGWRHPDIQKLSRAIIATLARPDAVKQWDISFQVDYPRKIIDTNPQGKRQTKKYNPVVPLIDPFADYLRGLNCWIEAGRLLTQWRTMRKNLGLPENTFAKTLRHSVITELQVRGAPEIEIEIMAGHRSQSTTRKHYTHYRPEYLAGVREALTGIYEDICGG